MKPRGVTSCAWAVAVLIPCVGCTILVDTDRDAFGASPGLDARPPLRDGGVPDRSPPDSRAPDGGPRDRHLPDRALPDGALPDGALPDGAGSDAARRDAAPDSAPDAMPECSRGRDCDDGNECTDDACRDHACVHTTLDMDGDGHGDLLCAPVGGVPADDCNDDEPAIRPGARERCNARDDDCNGGIDGPSVCPCEFRAHGDSAYLLCLEERSWDEAQAFCLGYGYDLATIDARAEQARLVSWATEVGGADANFYVGLRWRLGGWHWASNGQLDTLQLWESGEPDEEDCVNIDTDSGGWEDRDCATPEYFICEAPAA